MPAQHPVWAITYVALVVYGSCLKDMEMMAHGAHGENLRFFKALVPFRSSLTPCDTNRAYKKHD